MKDCQEIINLIDFQEQLIKSQGELILKLLEKTYEQENFIIELTNG